MGLRPARRVMHELFNLGELGGIELAARLGDRQYVPPGCKRMQRHAEIADDLPGLWGDVVEEEHQYMVDLRPGLAQCFAEIHLAAAIGGQILDQEHALSIVKMAFDLRI